MPDVSLKHIIGRPGQASALGLAIDAAVGASLTIEDQHDRVLHGGPRGESDERHPVAHGGVHAGWVSGGASAGAVAAMLEQLLAREAERKAMGTEVLHLYREVNLIYSFSEKLAALLDVEAVASLTLQEARHLIAATDGVILLHDVRTGTLQPVAGFGTVLAALAGMRLGGGVIGAIAARGQAEIVNYVPADPRAIQEETRIGSLMCAPLKVGELVIGVIALATVTPTSYSAGDLKLVNTLALQSATAIENARLFERTVQAGLERERLLALNQEAEVARAGFERELELAARIQADLFPAELPELRGYDLAARNIPARRCGGDYYDAILSGGLVESSTVLLCVADVSGKGVPASLLMSHMQATLRALLGRTGSLTDLASQASELLYASTAGNKYVTAALLDLDPVTGLARYVSAGHINSLLVGPGGDARWLGSTGAPLGLLPPGLPYEETSVQIEAGACLVLCSDGVTDAQNEAADEFGEDRLLALVRAAQHERASTIVTRVMEGIDAFVGGAPQFDDITILVLRRLH